jgi:hypothetical protein
MRQSAMASENATCSNPCRDDVEQAIIRAYVRLAVAPDAARGSSTATVARFGVLEVRLTEAPQPGRPDLPPFWLEMYSHVNGSTIDSFGCFEFDEDELAAAVEFVCEADHRLQTRN